MEYKSRLEFYIEKLGNVNDAIRAAKAEQELVKFSSASKTA